MPCYDQHVHQIWSFQLHLLRSSVISVIIFSFCFSYSYVIFLFFQLIYSYCFSVSISFVTFLSYSFIVILYEICISVSKENTITTLVLQFYDIATNIEKIKMKREMLRIISRIISTTWIVDASVILLLIYSDYFRFIFSMILFSRLLVSRLFLPAISSAQTENIPSTYASDAGADSRTWASGANGGYLLAFVTQNLSPLCSFYTWQNKQSVQCSTAYLTYIYKKVNKCIMRILSPYW